MDRFSPSSPLSPRGKLPESPRLSPDGHGSSPLTPCLPASRAATEQTAPRAPRTQIYSRVLKSARKVQGGRPPSFQKGLPRQGGRRAPALPLETRDAEGGSLALYFHPALTRFANFGRRRENSLAPGCAQRRAEGRRTHPPVSPPRAARRQEAGARRGCAGGERRLPAARRR